MPRKPGSPIRENIKKILLTIKELDGYHLYKLYISVFPQVTQRSIYYNLRKGAELGEFKISRVEKISGNFSWGDSSRKVFYSLVRLPEINITSKEKQSIQEAYEKIKNSVPKP